MTRPKEIDVRPILRDGGEPFHVIMEAVQSLAPGEALRLFTTFKPEPLFRVMDRRGFDHEAEMQENGEWTVTFTPRQTGAAAVDTSGDVPVGDWPDPEWHLDLTDLETPEPMVRILSRTERMQPGEVLFAMLSREPVLLLAELEKRGHQWAGNFDETGTVYRMLVRVGGAVSSR